VPSPAADASHAPTAAEEAEGDPAVAPFVPTGPVAQVLPLGAGLVLVGLGLGFLALRLRRS
jgi:hypothetical protein